MEFVRSVNLIRKGFPVQFWMLFIILPLAMMAMFASIEYLVPDLEGSWINVYSVTALFFLEFVNLCFWAKLHWQRMGKHELARKWNSYPYWMVVAIILAIIGS